MVLGELTWAHIGRTIKVRRDGPARVVASVRHYTITDEQTKEIKRKTSVMLRSTGAKGNDHLGEHIGDSADEIVLGNG
jgi:hypothetical protein